MGERRDNVADRRLGDRRGEHEPTPGVLFQMITDANKSQEADHARLRRELDATIVRFDAALARLATLETAHTATATHLSRLATAPVDATRVRFPLALILTMLGGFVALLVMVASFSGKVDTQNKANELAIQSLRSDMAAWRESTVRENAQNAKIVDERSLTMKEAVKTLEAQVRLQYAEFQTFRQEMARSSRR